jgi:hypothetical protein
VGGKMLQTVLEHLKEDGRLLQVLRHVPWLY